MKSEEREERRRLIARWRERRESKAKGKVNRRDTGKE